MCLADIFLFRSTWSSITSITCRHYQPETTLQEILEVSFSTPWCEFRWQVRMTAPHGYKWSWAQPKSCSFNPVSTLPKVEGTPRPQLFASDTVGACLLSHVPLGTRAQALGLEELAANPLRAKATVTLFNLACEVPDFKLFSAFCWLLLSIQLGDIFQNN